MIDDGTTALIGGARVPKHANRIESYGTIDELNAFVGLLMASDITESDREFLLSMQHVLFNIGESLANPDEGNNPITDKEARKKQLEKLEAQIDLLDDNCPPMTAFVLPSGCESTARAHICRTVCRRAERIICQLATDNFVESNLIRYVNRLSDYFFALARTESHRYYHKKISGNNVVRKQFIYIFAFT